MASVLTSGILGEQYVGLETGGEVEMLKEGSEITHTQGAMVLEKLIGQFFISKSQESGEGAK
jgi:phospholipid/cholesterol/gamma-HCH transport system substrate-binding protein